MRREWTPGLLAVVLLAGGAGLAWGDFAATVNPTQSTQTSISMGSTAGESLGWRFWVDEPIRITALGLYDAANEGGAAGDGLASSHVMGIWRVKKEGGLRLEYAKTISGQGDFRADGHAYTRIDPFTILPDLQPTSTGAVDRWMVGVWNPSDSTDELILDPPTAAALPIEQAGIIRFQNYTYHGWTAPPNTTLGDITNWQENWVPWGETTTGAHFGVNFEYTVVPVPGAILLGVVGLSSAGWLLRRRAA